MKPFGIPSSTENSWELAVQSLGESKQSSRSSLFHRFFISRSLSFPSLPETESSKFHRFPESGTSELPGPMISSFSWRLCGAGTPILRRYTCYMENPSIICMCICVYVYIYIQLYIYICISICTHTHTHMYVCM